jgi:hypothetical protein
VLMQQVYNLLSKMQESPGQISILPAPAASRTGRTESAITVEDQPTAARKVIGPGKRAAADKSRKRAKQRKPAVAKPEESATTMKKYLPTLNRAVRFFSRK